jgi:hypothetical protein
VSEWVVMEKLPRGVAKRAGAFIRRCGGKGMIWISAAGAAAVRSEIAEREKWSHLRILLNGKQFRVEACSASAPGARSISQSNRGGCGFYSAEFAAMLPTGARVLVTAHEGYVEGQIPEASS